MWAREKGKRLEQKKGLRNEDAVVVSGGHSSPDRGVENHVYLVNRRDGLQRRWPEWLGLQLSERRRIEGRHIVHKLALHLAENKGKKGKLLQRNVPKITAY